MKKITDLAKKLIKFKTVEGEYEEKKKIIEFVKKEFDKYPVNINEFEVNNIPSIAITLDKNPDIILSGHLDVVSGKKEDFIPKISNGKIYGRGAGDMKAALAAMIEVMKYFSKQKNKPSLGLFLTNDEETGGEYGTKILLKQFKPKLAIVPDGGKTLKNIILEEKGVLHFKIRAKGTPGHGSRPYSGKNAIDEIIRIYSELKKIIPDAKKGEWKNTLNLGKINGGVAINKIPDYAEAYFDARIINNKEREKIIKKIKKITENIEIIADTPALVQKIDKNIEIYKKIAEKEIKKKVSYAKVEGSSDARFFSNLGIPVIITRIDSENIHGDGEWTDIKQMNAFYKILINYLSIIDFKR